MTQKDNNFSSGKRSPAKVALILAVMMSSACAQLDESVMAASGAKRAVWIWEKDSFKLLDSKAARIEMLPFLVRKNVSVLYLYADTFQGRNILQNEPGKYRRFIAHMHKRGFVIYALLGSWYLNTPEYIFPEKRSTAVQMFQDVLTFNAGSDSESRFDGINIDIEPHMLDDWDENEELRALQYLDLSAEFMRLKREARSTMSVGPAIPFWFDRSAAITWHGQQKRLSEHVQDIYDYVAIMDYRNFAAGRDGMIAHAANELDYADSMGRRVVIGVETGRTEPDKVSFFSKGSAVMNAELDLAELDFSRHSSFAGFVIHHLGTYRALTESAGL